MHYPIPIHRQEAYLSNGGTDNLLPVTERVTGEILSLPIYPELSLEEVGYVCGCVREFCESRVEIER